MGSLSRRRPGCVFVVAIQHGQLHLGGRPHCDLAALFLERNQKKRAIFDEVETTRKIMRNPAVRNGKKVTRKELGIGSGNVDFTIQKLEPYWL